MERKVTYSIQKMREFSWIINRFIKNIHVNLADRMLKKGLTMIALLSLVNICMALDISVSNNWTTHVDKSDLQGGAGTDLYSIKASASAQANIDISNTTGRKDAWRVEVSRGDTYWPIGLLLAVRRTSKGNGEGKISGGKRYLDITTANQHFFSGKGDRSNITVQLKLEGISVQITPDIYITNIYYTVVDE